MQSRKHSTFYLSWWIWIREINISIHTSFTWNVWVQTLSPWYLFYVLIELKCLHREEILVFSQKRKSREFRDRAMWFVECSAPNLSTKRDACASKFCKGTSSIEHKNINHDVFNGSGNVKAEDQPFNGSIWTHRHNYLQKIFTPYSMLEIV